MASRFRSDAAHDKYQEVHEKLQGNLSGGRTSRGRWGGASYRDWRHRDVNEDSAWNQEGHDHWRMAYPQAIAKPVFGTPFHQGCRRRDF